VKKIIAILLITVHLFNLTGGSVFFEYLIHQNDVGVIQKIDNGNYNTASLIELKVPLTNPYYSSSLKYERYYGEINLDGNYYNYVMRKVINDTVYLLCLANNTKAELYKAKQDYASNAAGLDISSPVKKGLTPAVKKPAFSTEYFQQNDHFNLQFGAALTPCRKNIFSATLHTGFIGELVKPPEINTGNDPFYTGSNPV